MGLGRNNGSTSRSGPSWRIESDWQPIRWVELSILIRRKTRAKNILTATDRTLNWNPSKYRYEVEGDSIYLILAKYWNQSSCKWSTFLWHISYEVDLKIERLSEPRTATISDVSSGWNLSRCPSYAQASETIRSSWEIMVTGRRESLVSHSGWDPMKEDQQKLDAHLHASSAVTFVRYSDPAHTVPSNFRLPYDVRSILFW